MPSKYQETYIKVSYLFRNIRTRLTHLTTNIGLIKIGDILAPYQKWVNN